MKRASIVAMAAALALTFATALPAVASSGVSGTTPGTAQEIAQLVRVSTQIKALTPAVAEELTASEADDPARLYPSVAAPGCMGGVSCTFGKISARKSVVLFGDSHALMWLPALGGYALRNGLKLVVIWKPNSCAVALLPSNYAYAGGGSTAGCGAWHRAAVAMIKRLKPELVVLGERTSRVFAEPDNRAITDAVWRSALEKSIRQLATPATHVAVMEDLTERSTALQTCLAAYPTDIQRRCATPFPNPADPGHQQAELEAAKATDSTYIMTSQWFCTRSCSPVIGNFIPFYDVGHVSATYASFLSAVIDQQLKPFTS